MKKYGYRYRYLLAPSGTPTPPSIVGLVVSDLLPTYQEHCCQMVEFLAPITQKSLQKIFFQTVEKGRP
jgi:hypothetical protein